MTDNGNHQGQHATVILQALEDPRYEWRTIEGVSGQTGIPMTQVSETLESLKEDVVRSSVPDEAGRSLFTTRKHYRETHGLGARILSALSDKVA